MGKRKTISVDEDAYRILKSRKYPRDTWSEVIKREVMPVLEGEELVKALEEDYRKERKHGRAGR